MPDKMWSPRMTLSAYLVAWYVICMYGEHTHSTMHTLSDVHCHGMLFMNQHMRSYCWHWFQSGIMHCSVSLIGKAL